MAETLRPFVRQPRHSEGLLEEAAVAWVPVAERVPDRALQEREGHAALGHAGSVPHFWLRLGEMPGAGASSAFKALLLPCTVEHNERSSL